MKTNTGTIKVSRDKINKMIHDIVQDLVKMYENPEIEDPLIYAVRLGKLQGICEVFDIDFNDICTAAGLDKI